MILHTFIARKSDGSKVKFREEKVSFNETLNIEFIAKYCTCDETTQNTREIPNWDESEVLT